MPEDIDNLWADEHEIERFDKDSKPETQNVKSENTKPEKRHSMIKNPPSKEEGESKWDKFKI